MTADIGIVASGAYVPYWRLERRKIGEAWGIPAMPGERASAARDEDAVTLAVEAALAATESFDAEALDGVVFATTTSPYREKQGAATIATVLDCRDDVLTMDLTDSLRGATTGLRVAVDQVRAGSSGAVLVVAADARLGEPESGFEQMLGDGAGAAVVASAEWVASHDIRALPVAIDASAGVSAEFVGPWRTDADRYVRTFEGKAESRFGYAEQAAEAVRAVLEKAGIGPEGIDRAVIPAPDPRSQGAVVKAAGLGDAETQDLYFAGLGNLGTATPLVMLCGALEEAEAGERLLLVGAGDGADGIVGTVTEELPRLRDAGRWARLTPLIEAKGALPTYETYARNRRLVPKDRPERWSSALTYWRDIDMELPLYGMTCASCGLVQYPQGKRCMECSAAGPHEPTRLARRGKVFTFTLDHLVLGEYQNEPVPRAVIDLEGGGRIFCELTDCDPGAVHVDMPVELTFRLLHEGAGFKNYFWKGRPVRVGTLETVS